MRYLTEYKTPKFVLIHSVRYAVLLRIIQVVIFTYSTLYLLIYRKGYQIHDTTVISSVTLKAKGIGQVGMPPNKTIIMDVADYVIPPSENDAIFIMSNFIQTNQKQSICPESIRLKQAICINDDMCSNQPFIPAMNGRWTGRCLFTPEKNIVNQTGAAIKSSTGLCEYAGWCPPEDGDSSSMYVQGVPKFTIFIKTFIEFPLFGIKTKNMVDNLKPCVFDSVYNKDCPIFTIDYMLKEAEYDITERDLMLRYGGVINIKLHWNCNLDRNVKLCKPEYTFTRLDVPFREKPFSVGFNFRYTSTWKQNEEHFRTLTKAYGLRFIITVSGNAGKFNFITLTLNIGSLIGIFGIATFVSDVIVLYISKKAGVYRNYVFEKVHLKPKFDEVKDHVELQVEKNEDQLLNDASNMNT
ncbi:unnamed protein product [Rotaria sordida]|uniref:P2X purinoceptor n=1 Tax=Rotaria sordida TaxID=392033 RepID=A0A813Z4Q2_9BILA|nr:unnamed protein product [Rotaria sordida]CAF1146985.1 unnamed protein product [Rotaria sordida]